MDKQELDEILKRHTGWIRNEIGGSKANLRGADLYRTDLREADLYRANLREADLREAYLYGANLREADLYGAILPNFQITPSECSFVAWKKTSLGVIKILVPEDAKRTSSLIGRKCRASHVFVIDGPGCGGVSPTHGGLCYNQGETVYADEYDDDIRVECTHGIHFFMTKAEAEVW